MMGKQLNKNRYQAILAKGGMLIDVRDPVSFRDGTLPSAVNIPNTNMSQLMTKDKKTNLIFFGKNKEDPDLLRALNYASQLNFVNLFFIDYSQ